MTNKPFCQATQNNKKPILTVLEKYVFEGMHILEIGSGTGQHAYFFAEQLPFIHWQPTDLKEKLNSIYQWTAKCENVLTPFILDVTNKNDWPEKKYDLLFSANTAHIMPIEAVNDMIQLAAHCLKKAGVFLLYGPFNVNGKYTSDSNKTFNDFLKLQSPHMGIRDINDLEKSAKENDLLLADTVSMPANNQLLVLKKTNEQSS